MRGKPPRRVQDRLPELVRGALEGQLLVVVLALVGLAGLAFCTGLLRIVGGRNSVRPELAVRWATGRSARSLAMRLVRRAWAPLRSPLLCGVLVGVALAWVLRATWPISGPGGRPTVVFALLPLVVTVGAVARGRGLSASDDGRARAVGVVTAPFARAHFEGGRALGHRIRLGGGGERWITVVGVVEPLPTQVPGGPPPGAPVLYLALAQQPAREVVWSVAAPEFDQTRLAAVGLEAAGEVRTLVAVLHDGGAPSRWTGRVLSLIGGVGLLLALVGAAEVSRAEVRGRWRVSAIRSALGASPRRLRRNFLTRAAWTAVLGAGVGWVRGLEPEHGRRRWWARSGRGACLRRGGARRVSARGAWARPPSVHRGPGPLAQG